MIVIYEYPDKTVRYTDVAVLREQLDRKHVVKLRNGKYVVPKQGWTNHFVRLEKGGR